LQSLVAQRFFYLPLEVNVELHFTRGVLERNEPGKVGRKMQARQYQNSDVVNKGNRPYTP
jgi:hypothetical protein